MADDINIGALLVEMRADIKQLQASLKQGEKEVEDTSSKMSKEFKKMGAELAKAFTLAAIAKFVQGSIKEFAKLEDSLDKLGKAVSGTGQDWKNLKAGVVDFAKEIERTTKFQDDEVVQVLTKVDFKVKDLAKSMGIVRMATKLADLTGVDLAATSETLSLAYQGNSRGVMQLAKSLGVVGKQSEDVGFLFAELEKRTSAFSGETESLQETWEQFVKTFKTIMQEVGEALAPATKFFMNLARVWIPDVWKGIKGLGVAWQGIFLDLGTYIENAKARFSSFFTFVKSGFGNVKAALVYIEEMQRLDQALRDDLKINAQVTQAEFDKIYNKGAANRNETDAKTLAEQARLNKARLDKEKVDEDDMLARQLAEQARNQKMRQKMTDDYFKELDDQRKKDTESAQQSAETISKYTEDLASVVIAAAKSGQEAFAALGRAMVKSIVGALAAVLDQKATAAFLEGTLKLASGDYSGWAKNYAAGGIVAAAAGVMRGAANAYLAEGGIVTSPTRAVIGEGGEPEAVVPLSKAGAMGFGGGSITQHIGISLPNVKKPEDFGSPEARRTISRVLAETLQHLQDRKGLRLQPGIA